MSANLPAAYGFPVVGHSGLLTGRGQHLGIVGFGGSIREDQFQAQAPGKVQTAPPQAITRVDPGFAAEIRMDLEIVLACAPEAQVTVYAFDATEEGWIAGLRGLLDNDAPPSVLSVSWGWPETGAGEPFWTTAGVEASEALLAELAGRRVTVVACTGDAGAAICYPGSSAWVLACGGTEFCGPEERVWAMTGYASGGGMSSVIPMPAWQARAGIRCEGVPTLAEHSHRCVPDVAASAVVSSPVVGGAHAGTSAAAPLWAGLISLCNERRAQMGRPPVGPVNAPLYDRSTGLQAACHEIRVGNNSTTGGPPYYRSSPGWNACGGWGSPKAAEWVEAIARMP